MFLFYVLCFFKKGDTIQGGILFKEIRYSQITIISYQTLYLQTNSISISLFLQAANMKSSILVIALVLIAICTLTPVESASHFFTRYFVAIIFQNYLKKTFPNINFLVFSQRITDVSPSETTPSNTISRVIQKSW